jgi:hypothetical protein
MFAVSLTIFAATFRAYCASAFARSPLFRPRNGQARMSEAMQPDGLARPNFGAVSRNHHAKANADEDAAQQGRVSEIN